MRLLTINLKWASKIVEKWNGCHFLFFYGKSLKYPRDI